MTRQILDALSKALVATAVMLSVLILVAGPISASYARGFTAVLLAVGTIGLVGLKLFPVADGKTVSQRQ
jgi:hypothetical protein